MRGTTTHLYQLLITAVLLALPLLQACEQNSAGPFSDQPPPPDERLLTSAAGYLVTADRMEANMKDITRGIALALADPLLRNLVLREIQASLVKEGKLHLRTFLTGTGADLLTAVAVSNRSSEDAVLRQLDSVFDLEFYMPVKAHRETWSGDSRLLVATVLRDDGTIPTAFDLSGQSVRLTSANLPPSTPTLAVVPAESDFSTTLPLGGDAGMGRLEKATSSTDGVYMTRAFVAGSHEGWMMGDPEFEMHVFAGGPSDTLVDLSCAGEHASGAYYFDQDDGETWIGEVLLNEPATGDSTVHVIMMWENDADACAFPSSGGRPPRVESGSLLGSFLTGLGGPLAVVSSFTDWTLKPIVNWVSDIVEYYQKDDPVGVAELPSCFATETGGMRLWLTNASTHTGWVDIDFRGVTRDPLCEDPPPPPPSGPPPFSVEIVGPDVVREYTECLWTSSTTEGTAPYTYMWYRDGNPVSTADQYLGETGTLTFTLWLHGFDAGWGFAADTLTVTVTQEQYFCPT